MLAPVAVVTVAVVVTVAIINSKPPVAKKEPVSIVRQVQAIAFNQQTASFPLLSQGVVLPLTRISFLSEVAGRVLEVSPKWGDGGFFKKGDVLLRIEDHAYKSQLAKAEAQLAQAKSTLTQEQAQAYVAKKNWEASNRAGDDPAGRSLALREPQLATAKSQLAAAEVDVATARIMLAKTTVTAPFDGVVSKKLVDVGQVVGTGQQLADFYGTAKAEIRVPLTQAQQMYLSLPPLVKDADIKVDVLYKTAGGTHQYQGLLRRTSAVLDEATRVLHGIVEVDDPYGVKASSQPVLPLGAFVEISINSDEQANVMPLPQRLLRPGNRIWVADKDDRLQLREVELLPSRGEVIYVSGGLQAEDRIITSSIVDANPGNLVSVVLNDKVEN